MLEKTPPSCLALLSETVSEMGWGGCPFTEDGLSSKKLYPGWVYKHSKKNWENKCAVTEDSMLLMLRQVISEWRKDAYRRKPARKALEEASEMAALVDWVRKTVLSTTPLSPETVQTCLVDVFADNTNAALQLELACAVNEKPSDFSPHCLTVIRDALQAHASQAATQVNGGNPAKKMILENNLEHESFALLQDTILHDVNMTIAHNNKVQSYQSLAYWKELDWKRKSREKVEEGVKSFMDTCVRLVATDNPDQVIKQYVDFKIEIKQMPLVNVAEGNLVSRAAGDKTCFREGHAPDLTCATICDLLWGAL